MDVRGDFLGPPHCTTHWSSSGPKAFEGFRLFSNFVTPSLVTTMFSMNGADLSRRGTLLCSFLVKTSVNWPLNSLAFSKSDWARPLPCLFFKGGIPWVLFSDCLCNDKNP